jgi:hypothetical protein
VDSARDEAPWEETDGSLESNAANVAAVTRRVDRLTLVNGRSFVVAHHDGSLVCDGDGLIVFDLRVLSNFVVEVVAQGTPVTRVDTLFAAAFDAAEQFAGRNPELFAGIDRSLAGTPVAYPRACSPQAWASASTLLNLRSLVGLEPPRAGTEVPRVAPRTLPYLHRIEPVRVGSERFALLPREGEMTAVPIDEAPDW